jgi:ABC-2 type transport system ATP-binding protein
MGIPMKIVSVSNISKNYGKVTALKKISFDVEKGEIFGLIGPDGAGKTTLFRILTTLILADSGTAVVDGSDVVQQYKEIRKKVGYMPGKFSLYKDLTVEENLKIFATLFGTTIQENYHLIKAIYSQIEPFKNRRAGDLSGGMKQKLALSCALIHEPVVLFLDEPTTGVDPVSRKELWEVLKGLKEEGVTIVISTPYMDEASLCDRVSLMQKGTFMQIDSPENVIASFKKTLWSVRSRDMYRLLRDLRQNSQIESSYSFGDAHHVIPVFDRKKSLAPYREEELREFLLKRDHTNIEILPIRAGIEDCFMQLTEK